MFLKKKFCSGSASLTIHEKNRTKGSPPKNRGTNGTNGTFLCNQGLTLFFSVPTLSTLGTKTTDLTTKSIHAIFCSVEQPIQNRKLTEEKSIPPPRG
jgi:hypothetical protein